MLSNIHTHTCTNNEEYKHTSQRTFESIIFDTQQSIITTKDPTTSAESTHRIMLQSMNNREWEKINHVHNLVISIEECKILKYSQVYAILRDQIGYNVKYTKQCTKGFLCCRKRCYKPCILSYDIGIAVSIGDVKFNIDNHFHRKILNSLFYLITGYPKGLWIEMGFDTNCPDKHISHLLQLVQLLFLCEYQISLYQKLSVSKAHLISISFLCSDIFLRIIKQMPVQKYYASNINKFSFIHQIYCSLIRHYCTNTDRYSKPSIFMKEVIKRPLNVIKLYMRLS